MLQKISTVLLSMLFVVFAALQVHAVQPEEKQYAIKVQPHVEDSVASGEAIDGEIRITAAMREMKLREDVTVKFMLSNDRYTYRTTVVVTPENIDENGLLSATASFEKLLSGAYQLRIEHADGAELSYILAEKGGTSKYTMQTDSITFYLSQETSSGSAWFMMDEAEVES